MRIGFTPPFLLSKVLGSESKGAKGARFGYFPQAEQLGQVSGRDCIKPGSNKVANRLFAIPHKKVLLQMPIEE
jgi:hypothetical protein